MRDKNYRREVRKKAIIKKLNIRKFSWGTEEYYEHNPVGALAKGKVHLYSRWRQDTLLKNI